MTHQEQTSVPYAGKEPAIQWINIQDPHFVPRGHWIGTNKD
jgi:hypothetical protein